MKITKYNKLVRDNIPNIIEQDNRQAIYIQIADKDELLKYLNQKLNEEIDEYNNSDSSNDIEELADIMEIVNEILKVKGCDSRNFNNIMKEKKKV